MYDNWWSGVGEMYSCRMPKASLMVRLSKQAGDTNLSLEGMMTDCRQLAGKLGCDVYAEHVDDGISGAVRDRPEFTAWLDDARTGMVDVLITASTDRLTREGINAAAMVLDVVEGKDPVTGRVVRKPVRLVTVDGIDSEHGDAFRWRFVIAAEVARSERERIKARNINTQRRLREAKRYRGGGAPWGTRVEHSEEAGGKVLVPDETEGDALRAVASKLLAGEGLRECARWLHNQGHRTRRGKEWTRSSLRATLLSETTKDLVLDLATYKAVEAHLDERKGSLAGRGGRRRRWLLAGGQAVCGTCGMTMTTSAGRYVCGSNTSGAAACPFVVTIDAAAVDAWVEERFLDRFGPVAPLEMRLVVTGGEDLDASERAVEAAEKALLADLTPENMEALRRAREAFESASEEPRSIVPMYRPMKQTVAELWAMFDPEDRAQLLASVLEERVVISRNPGGRPRGRQKVNVAGRVSMKLGNSLPVM